MDARPVEADNGRCAAGAEALLAATSAALQHLAQGWDRAAVDGWIRHLSSTRGRVILCGMGKSGLVAQKISATLASTGCPSFFLHPAEALHGDLGMVTPEDSLLILSNSGETEEVVRLLPSLMRLGVPYGAITSNQESTLAKSAKWCFIYTLPNGEGCPLNFAPMASTTLQLVWGDLLATYQMISQGFTLENFAAFHPAGNLGARLLRVEALMHTEFPRVAPEDGFLAVLSAMTQGKLGMTTVVDSSGLVGVISDGDIRRGVSRSQQENRNPLELRAQDLMTRNPQTVGPQDFALEAARVMEGRKITFLVASSETQPLGVLHIHDLLAAKVI